MDEDSKKKVREEKRKLQDKVSQMMGDYLLKGYRMLDSYCGNCESILMKSRDSETSLCIQCMLHDQGNDNRQDATPTNQATQSSSIPASTITNTVVSTPVTHMYPPTSSQFLPQPHLLHSNSGEVPDALLRPEGVESQYTFDEDLEGSVQSSDVELKSAVGSARRALARKLTWASRELERTTSIEYCTQLAGFIKTTSEAVQKLKDLP